MTFNVALLAIIGVAAGLEVGPIRVVGNLTHITYSLGPSSNSSVLECPYELSEGEELQKMSWALWKGDNQVGTYEWSPTGEEIATGLLDGMVNLTRDDGDLEFTKLKYELGGFYSCSATLIDGQVKEAAKWEALVIDTTSSHTYDAGHNNYTSCTYHSTLELYTMYPPPTVNYGMYSQERGGYVDKVTSSEWVKIEYANMSVGYSLKDRIFQIDANTPHDAQLVLTVGVTKTDGSYISLLKTTATNIIWAGKQGCPVPRIGQHQILLYSTGNKNCRDQLVPFIPGTPLKATVRCVRGYHAEGEVTLVVMECDTETLKWTTKDRNETRIEDLQCVVDQPHPRGSSADVASSAALVMGTLLLLCLLQE